MSNGIYLIYGTDYEAIQKKIEDIESSLNLNFDETKIDLEQESILSLIEEVQTIPFLTDVKIVIVKNASEIFENKSISEEYVNRLINYGNKPVSTTVLIYVFDHKIEESNPVFKALKKNGEYIKIDEIDDSNMYSYVEQLFTTEYYTIERDAVDLLVSEVDNPKAIRVEVEKLKTFCYETKKVTKNDVDLLIPRNIESNIYELTNAVLAKDKNRAMHIYIDLQMQNTQPSYIISQLLTKFQEMYDIKKLMTGGYSQEEIATLYNVKSGRAYYMCKNASSANVADIEKKLKQLSDIDAESKSGYVDGDTSLQMFMLR